jgi:protein-L-isoaspartate(D-aspartate) O-methyltransferase
LEAIGKVPRHFFFDDALLEHAYQDKAFPIGEGQTISQPYTVAFQTEKLEVRPGDKVLEVGTGSGYQACVLLELGAKVYTIEYNRNLYEKARTFLPSIGYRPTFFHPLTVSSSPQAPLPCPPPSWNNSRMAASW